MTYDKNKFITNFKFQSILIIMLNQVRVLIILYIDQPYHFHSNVHKFLNNTSVMEVAFTVLAIGLSNSGKTTLIRSYLGRTQEVYPTAGFEINYLTTGHKTVLVYDCSGEGHSRQTWNILYNHCDVVLYVIDAYDIHRFSIAKQTLDRFIDRNKSMKKKCLCIMLNKCDLNSKVDKQILVKALDLQKLQKFVGKVYVKQTSGYNKIGLEECFDWMSHNTQQNN